MKIAEFIAIIAAISCGGCLASIQIRKFMKGELSLFGLQSFKENVKIELDTFDKIMVLLSGILFLLCIIFALMSYA